MRGIIAGGVIVLAASAALFFLFSGNDAAPKAKSDKARGRIKEVTPAAAPKVEPEKPKKPIDPREDYDHEKIFRDKDGILKYKHDPSLWAYDKSAKRRKPIVLGGANRPSPFARHSEREIAALLTFIPGERQYNSVNYSDPDFIQDFQESLLEKIEIKPDDREDDKELKQAVIDVKKELVARIKQGENLADILNESRKEIERLAEYKQELQAQVSRIIKDGDGSLSEQDVKDCVAAANKMLEENGINPVEPNEMVLWNIRLNAEKQGMSEQEIQDAEDAAEEKLNKEAAAAAEKNANQE